MGHGGGGGGFTPLCYAPGWSVGIRGKEVAYFLRWL